MEPEGGAAVRLAVERNIPAHLFDQTLVITSPSPVPPWRREILASA